MTVALLPLSSLKGPCIRGFVGAETTGSGLQAQQPPLYWGPSQGSEWSLHCLMLEEQGLNPGLQLRLAVPLPAPPSNRKVPGSPEKQK